MDAGQQLKAFAEGLHDLCNFILDLVGRLASAVMRRCWVDGYGLPGYHETSKFIKLVMTYLHIFKGVLLTDAA